MSGPKVLAVALDAADLTLLRRLAADGSMPVFAALHEGGASGTLSSHGRWLPGSVWPTFWTSTPPSEHGFHHHLQWAPERMRLARPDAAMPGVVPFWRRFEAEGARVLALDMPFTSAPSSGVELCGWSTLDSLEPPCAFPPSLLDEVGAWHGRSLRTPEMHALQSVDRLLALRDEQITIAAQLADTAERLLARERFDVATITLPGPHRGGHWLWDEGGLQAEPSARERERLRQALPAVYAATDRALGRILEAADADEVIVYSLHGMRANTSRVEILGEMLRRVLGATDRHGSVTLAERLRHLVPSSFRHAVKTALPTPWQDRLTGYWRIGGHDWTRTPAISLVADLSGYIRLNRVGREAEGIVGEDRVREVMDTIVNGLAGFLDADTDQAVVRETARIDAILSDGPRIGDLPDLIVDWVGTPARRHRALVSPRFGRIDWPTPGRHPSGRSGNHDDGGFYVAQGSGLSAADGVPGHIMDLAPTILERLGEAIPDGMHGRPLLPGSGIGR